MLPTTRWETLPEQNAKYRITAFRLIDFKTVYRVISFSTSIKLSVIQLII